MNIYHLPEDILYIEYLIMFRPYKDYTKYILMSNPDNVEHIYVDNNTCIDKPINKDNHNMDLPFYVEIHYTKESNKKHIETIMKNHELDSLIQKYICKL